MEGLKFSLKLNPEIAKFLYVFLVSLSVMYMLSIGFEGYIPLFSMRSTAQVLSFSLNGLGIKHTLNGGQLSFMNFSIEIVRQCTGIFEVMAVTACIIAFPSSIKKKLLGIGLALPLIYLFNMARLVLLSVLGIYNQTVFTAVHDYLLEITFLLLVVSFWLFWTNKVVKSER